MKKQSHYIIFLTQTNKLSGGEKSLLDLMKGIKDEIKIGIIIPGEGELNQECIKEGINVFTVSRYKFYDIKKEKIFLTIFFIRQFIKSISEIKMILKKEKPDILWTNSQKAHIIGVFFKLFLNLKLVWHFRDIHQGLNRLLVNFLSIFPDKIIAISNEVKRQFIFKQKICVIYNGIKIPEKLNKKIRGKFLKLGYVAQIAEWKGQINFIKVLEMLENAKGYIIGDVLFEEKDYLEKIKKYINEKNLNDRVIFTGFKKDVLNYIYSMDIILHLPEKPEPFGRILIESMALGIPVIAYDIGAIKEILSGTGILVKYGDLNKVVEWVNILSKHERKRREIGYNEKMVFLKKYHVEQYVYNIKNVIKKF